MSQNNNHQMLNYRRINLLGLLISGGAVGAATLYLQSPTTPLDCPLCMLTRLLLLSMAGVFLLAFLHNPGTAGQRFYGLINLLLSLTGLAGLARYLWLQQQPDPLATRCISGLEPLLEQLPFADPLQTLLHSGSECAINTPPLLGLSLPQQAVIIFALLLLLVWKQLRKRAVNRSIFS
ncbi:disulfide bond formation protein B [Marinobacterium arenosum]|uniref:disulfide bond formation protein B n=1 Tax=Marinobacterium arenosum TaxID=2862496 RepID=UPI001C95BECC|nr:disulfide bond formation protein B [Marinobacterium arenosum]MBY4676342.1 disulfide bond formation protein B [Marinobacterium arenosum]